MDTLHRLLELRAKRNYRELSALIVPDRAAQVVRFLTAVDDFLDANRRLCNWLRDNVGVGLSQEIDQSYVADDLAQYAGDDLGVFGRRVRLLDAAVHDDQAAVSYVVDGCLPARQARLRKVGAAWRYDPGTGYSEHLPAAFNDMARGLELLLAELRSGSIPRQQLLDSPGPLRERVAARLRRGVELLTAAQAARDQQGAPP